jgi:tetratricopeptide (TPR) repeat protein
MSPRGLLLALLLLPLAGGIALPVQAQTVVRTSCQGRTLPSSVTDARAALDKEPEELAPRMRLANALIDQGCYEDAVGVLEAGLPIHPHSTELSGKLRDVRSLVTEQTYIQGMAQAADAAKLQHSQLRCTRFGDLEACNLALKSTPDDPAMLMAKADALMQAGRAAEALAIYQHVAQLSPGNDAVRNKLSAAQARVNTANAIAQTDSAPQGSAGRSGGEAASPPASSAAAATGSARVPGTLAAESQDRRSGSAMPTRGKPAAPARVASAPKSVPPQIPAPAIEPVETPTFSNEAPPGRSN